MHMHPFMNFSLMPIFMQFEVQWKENLEEYRQVKIKPVTVVSRKPVIWMGMFGNLW